MSLVDWSKLLQIEDKWIEKHLIAQTAGRKPKTSIRGYTIKFSGTKNSYTSFAQALNDIIGQFTHGKAEIAKKGLIRAHSEAKQMFGNINPSTEGKYGELILFALVESILRCPMVAHKIPSSFHDQVKGGDGLFMGKYEIEPNEYHDAILIGESKIWQGYSTALGDSLDSINRFHEGGTSARFNSQEFIVAKKGIAFHDDIDPEALYDCLSPDSDYFKNSIVVHPTFIMYETNEIGNIENKALTPKQAEELIKIYITKRHLEHTKLISDKIEKYPELSKIYLDFFILPVRNVDEFRNELFFNIHGINYTDIPKP